MRIEQLEIGAMVTTGSAYVTIISGIWRSEWYMILSVTCAKTYRGPRYEDAWLIGDGPTSKWGRVGSPIADPRGDWRRTAKEGKRRERDRGAAYAGGTYCAVAVAKFQYFRRYFQPSGYFGGISSRMDVFRRRKAQPIPEECGSVG